MIAAGFAIASAIGAFIGWLTTELGIPVWALVIGLLAAIGWAWKVRR